MDDHFSKPRYTNYRQKAQEEQILPRLFTPNKAHRAHGWLRSGNYSYDEKLAVLKTLWIKDEERRVTDKVLKQCFLPQVAPRVQVWINEAEAEEKKAIMKLFRSIDSKPTTEKITAVSTKPEKTCDPSRNNSTECPQTGHGLLPQTRDSEAMKAQKAERSKVKWEDGRPTIKAHNKGRIMAVAQMRSEFDIAPDWRAPKRSVVPMTQLPRRVIIQERLPRVSKHICLHNQREFVIHPEWVIH